MTYLYICKTNFCNKKFPMQFWKSKKKYVENSIKKIRHNKLIPAKTKAPVSKILITNLVNTELMNLTVR